MRHSFRLVPFFKCSLAVGLLSWGLAAAAEEHVPADAVSSGQSSEAAVVVEELQAQLAALDQFDSAFRQTVYSADGAELQDVEGHLSATRRGEVRWETAAPYEQLLVSDGATIWLYDPDLEQVTVRPFRRNIAETPAMLLIGDTTQLAAEYRVLPIETERGQHGWQLVPHEPGAMFERIELVFERDVPLSMKLWDAMEQVTVITFSDSSAAPDLDPELFQFEAPPGTDVLYDD